MTIFESIIYAVVIVLGIGIVGNLFSWFFNIITRTKIGGKIAGLILGSLSSNKERPLLEKLLNFIAIAAAIMVGVAILLVMGSFVTDWFGWTGLIIGIILFLLFLWWDHKRVLKKKRQTPEIDLLD